jgi:DNA-binding MarR family transcriptional regulator
MSPTLKDELQQRKPFHSLEEEAFLNVVRTQAELSGAFDRLLRPHGVSGPQYNVLRILRGAGPNGLCRNEIRDRLITRMPDVTRLLDRMEEAGLVTRSRSESDRRQVGTRLTERGSDLVERLDGLVADEHQRRLGHLEGEQLQQLIELLTLARQQSP